LLAFYKTKSPCATKVRQTAEKWGQWPKCGGEKLEANGKMDSAELLDSLQLLQIITPQPIAAKTKESSPAKADRAASAQTETLALWKRGEVPF
jgi:hypothetical protein